jgi:hypothetical protein
MSAEPDDSIHRDITRVLHHLQDLFATLQQQYREHLELETMLEAGALEHERREDRARRRASARKALAESEAKMDQIKVEVERSIQSLRKDVDQL